MTARDPAPRRFPRALTTALWVLAGLALWATRFSLPRPAAGPDLDPAWQQALAQALVDRVQFGPDLVFTFGPLAGLHYGRFQPELWWPKILLWEVLWKGLAAWRWIEIVRARPSPLLRAGLFAALLLMEFTDDAWFLLFALAIGLRHLSGPPARSSSRLLDFALLSVGALLKFPYFVVGALAVAALAAFEAQRGWRRAAGVVALAAAALLAVWSACGQAFWNLPTFVLRGLHLAGLYPEGQANEGGNVKVLAGIALCGLLAALCYFAWRAWRPRGQAACAFALALAVVFIAFRSGFTIPLERSIVFYEFATVAPFLIVAPAWVASASLVQTSRRAGLLADTLRWLTVALAAYCAMFPQLRHGPKQQFDHRLAAARRQLDDLGRARDLGALHDELARQRAELARRWSMPRTRAAVGTGSVAVFGFEQPLVLLNGLRWRPFPVLQPYLALSERLSALDEQFLLGPDAPDFVLMRASPIDNRPGGLEDARALEALLSGWQPVLRERQAILFRRRDAPAERAVTEVLRRTLRAGEPLDLSAIEGRALRLRLEVRPTLLGRLRALALRPPRILIRMRHTNGFEAEFRAPRGMLATGFLVRPALGGMPEWIDVYKGRPVPSVTEFRWGANRGPRPWFELEAELVVERCDALLPEPDPEAYRGIEPWILPWQPISWRADIGPNLVQVRESEVLVVGAPSTLLFLVPPEGGRVHGVCGIGPRDDGVPSNPVRFRAVLVQPDFSSEIVWSADLVPGAGRERVPARELDFTLPAGPAGRRLRLETEPIDPKNAFALAFWQAIALD